MECVEVFLGPEDFAVKLRSLMPRACLASVTASQVKTTSALMAAMPACMTHVSHACVEFVLGSPLGLEKAITTKSMQQSCKCLGADDLLVAMVLKRS